MNNSELSRIASKVLAIEDLNPAQALWVVGGLRGGGAHPLGITVGQVRALASSCLMQAAPSRTMIAADIGCVEVKCVGKGDPPMDCIWPDCHCSVYYAPEFRDMYYLQWILGREFQK